MPTHAGPRTGGEASRDGLGDQQVIEGISVVHRKTDEVLKVLGADLKRFEALRADGGNDVTDVALQLSNAHLHHDRPQ